MSRAFTAAELIAAARDRGAITAKADRLAAESERAAADADRLAVEAAETLRLATLAERVTDVVDGQPLECITEYEGTTHERVRVVNLTAPLRYATYATAAPYGLSCATGRFDERLTAVDQPDLATARAAAIAWVLAG